MSFEARVAEQVARLPVALKQLLDAELAAGNIVNSLEHGVGPDKGKAALILERAFRTKPADAPAGVLHRHIERKDLDLYEFYVAGEPVSILTAKFKPMKLQPLGPGPEDPTAAHVERMKQRAKEEEEAAAKRRAEAARPPPPQMARLIRRGSDNPLDRFLASMVMDYEMWHEGLSYDLAMLDKLAGEDLKVAELALINHSPLDWRDIEALARIDTPTARKAVVAGLRHADPAVRRAARKHAGDQEDPAEREQLLIRSLEHDDIFGGLSQSLDEVEDVHPPAVIDALFRGALKRDGEAAVHFAAMLYYLHGKAKAPFDWDHRPFFLRFHSTDRGEREQAFRELCDTVGVDPTTYLN
jgi:hypothetical protein